MEKLYSLYQVARIFSVDYQTVWRWVRQGRINAFKTPGNQWRIKASDVDRITEAIPNAAEHGTREHLTEARAAG